MSIFAAASRWRVWFLVGAFAVAVLLLTFDVMAFGFILTLALIVTAAFAQAKYHPADLVTRPDTSDVTTVANPGPVFSASGFTILGVALVSDDFLDLVNGRDIWWGDPASSLLWVALVGFWWYIALGPWGIRISHDGIHDRQPLGRMFVPWAALDESLPVVPGGQNQVFLHYDRRDLIVRRGLRQKPQILNPTSDAALVADAINVRWAESGRHTA